MRTRMYGGVRGRKTKIGGKPTFVFLLLDFLSRRIVSGCFLCVVLCGGSAVPFLNRDAEFLAVFPALCPVCLRFCVVPCRDA